MHGKSLGIMEGRKDEERKEGRKGGGKEKNLGRMPLKTLLRH